LELAKKERSVNFVELRGGGRKESLDVRFFHRPKGGGGVKRRSVALREETGKGGEDCFARGSKTASKRGRGKTPVRSLQRGQTAGSRHQEKGRLASLREKGKQWRGPFFGIPTGVCGQRSVSRRKDFPRLLKKFVFSHDVEGGRHIRCYT